MIRRSSARTKGGGPNGTAGRAAGQAADRLTARRVATLVGLALGITAVGLVAGAAVAAPGEMLVLGRWAASEVAGATVPMATHAWSTVVQETGNAGDWIMTAARTPRTPRETGMLVSGALALLFSVAATVRALQSSARRRGERTPFAGIGFPRGGLSLAGVAPTRRPSPRTTPKEVRALVERGRSLTEIARRTGLPVDALTMLLAVSEPGRQVRP